MIRSVILVFTLLLVPLSVQAEEYFTHKDWSMDWAPEKDSVACYAYTQGDSGLELGLAFYLDAYEEFASFDLYIQAEEPVQGFQEGEEWNGFFGYSNGWRQPVTFEVMAQDWMLHSIFYVDSSGYKENNLNLEQAWALDRLVRGTYVDLYAKDGSLIDRFSLMGSARTLLEEMKRCAEASVEYAKRTFGTGFGGLERGL